jgi:hypothetical protein
VQDRSEEAFREAYISIREDGRQLEIARAKRSHEHEDDREPAGEVLQLEENDPDEPEGSTRGKITHFSRSSRRRLRRLFHSLRRDVPALLVTLTYHETDPAPKEAKRHLDAFHKRFRRYCAKGNVVVGVIWRMEAQKRGTVHFHLMLFGTRYLSAEKASKWWHEVTDETSEQHRKSGVDIELVEEVEQAAAYCSKYLAKESEEAEWDEPGRFWGVFRKLALPVARWSRDVRITDEEAAFLIDRLLNEWDVDLPQHASVPRLIVNTLGDPNDRLDRLLDRIANPWDRFDPSEIPVPA